ncbi:MAG: NUDIX domain-containing protein [Candidatus Marsarchaeota archaeon]|jgi:8-oxo-dGTP pyrophosphatase MutT (NUDIX family)|nr:NUDIX domain-containing protein [Candidatus Marsarchaeota archaeon]
METRCICGSSAVIMNGKVFLLWHKKLQKWIYPGGHVDEGEMPHETAVRETAEETGYSVRLVSALDYGWRIDNPDAEELACPFTILYEKVRYQTGVHYHFDMVYLAVPVGERKEVGEHESMKMQWFGEDEIDALDMFDNVKQALHRAFQKASEAGIL